MFGELLKFSTFDQIEIIVLGITFVLAIFLSALCFNAYRKTRLKKMSIAAVAFALFAVYSLTQDWQEISTRNTSDNPDYPITDLVLPVVLLAIVILFFAAIIRKDTHQSSYEIDR